MCLMILNWEGQGACTGELNFRMMKSCCSDCCSLQAKHKPNIHGCRGGRRESARGHFEGKCILEKT